MKTSRLIYSIGALTTALMFANCQDEELGYTADQIAYQSNFQKMYGKISEDQIWDFSSYNLKKLGLTGGPSSNIMTRAGSGDVHRADDWTTGTNPGATVLDQWYTVTEGTMDWLNANLPEKTKYTGSVSAFTLKKTDNFYIIPIYQGQSGMIWDLELVDNNGRHRIWTKSKDMQYTYDFSKWEEFFYDTNSDETYNTRYQTDLSITNDKLLPFVTGEWDSGLAFNTSNLILGDIINIAVSDQGNDPQVGLRKGSDWKNLNTDNLSAYVNASNSTVTINITQAHLDALSEESKFVIQGKNVTITSVKRSRGGGNKGMKFQRIFQYFDKDVNYKYAKVCFEIPASVGLLQGYFYIQDGNDYIPITKSHLTGDGTTTTATIADDGLFTFNSSNNPIFNKDGTLYSGGNQVDFTNLIGKSINGHYIGDHFENLVFHATNTNFNTYTEDSNRIKVFVKYNATQTVGLSNDASTAYVDGHTINKRNVQTKLIKIDKDKIDGLFKFNLYTTALTSGDQDGFSDYGANHYSDTEYMLALTAFTSDNSPVTKSNLQQHLNETYQLNLPDDFEYMVLSCEDADGPKSDKDYNDVIFLLVGYPHLPEISDETIQKRYMIEDLGSTFDFDFNDIVVDVSEEHVRNLANNSEIKVRQTATISHLCGTIPFKVFLGSKSFGDKPMYGHNNNNSADGYNPTNSSYTTELYMSEDWISNPTEGSLATLRRNQGIWDPDANNIKVYVWPNKRYNESAVDVFWNDYNASTDGEPNDNIKGEPNHVYAPELIQFPNKGKFPYIIATNPDIEWMKENVSIPESWIIVVPDEYHEYNGNSGGSGSGTGDSGTGSDDVDNNSKLSVSVSNPSTGGTTEISPAAGSYDPGTEIKVTAPAETYGTYFYRFDYWKKDGVRVENANREYTFTLSSETAGVYQPVMKITSDVYNTSTNKFSENATSFTLVDGYYSVRVNDEIKSGDKVTITFSNSSGNIGIKDLNDGWKNISGNVSISNNSATYTFTKDLSQGFAIQRTSGNVTITTISIEKKDNQTITPTDGVVTLTGSDIKQDLSQYVQNGSTYIIHFEGASANTYQIKSNNTWKDKYMQQNESSVDIEITIENSNLEIVSPQTLSTITKITIEKKS